MCAASVTHSSAPPSPSARTTRTTMSPEPLSPHPPGTQPCPRPHARGSHAPARDWAALALARRQLAGDCCSVLRTSRLAACLVQARVLNLPPTNRRSCWRPERFICACTAACGGVLCTRVWKAVWGGLFSDCACGHVAHRKGSLREEGESAPNRPIRTGPVRMVPHKMNVRVGTRPTKARATDLNLLFTARVLHGR